MKKINSIYCNGAIIHGLDFGDERLQYAEDAVGSRISHLLPVVRNITSYYFVWWSASLNLFQIGCFWEMHEL